ncbi:MAG TPA: hypothetical protein VMV59_02285 [Candidatus Dormibacteraeota bacterium]|nr:hypothetical protein [Candidatus Dormibacteraeota bacterium]
MSLFTNPEVVRNARIQLRPRKLLIAAGLCAAVSLAIGYAYAEDVDGLAGENGNSFLHTILIIQAVVLVIGGGIACLHAIQREKDQNTFDFQRLTRLSPLELTLGKLFGAPLMVFFVFFCFIPAAIVGAVAARSSWTIGLAAYVLLILGSIAYLAFALVISLFLRRGAITWAILFFLVFVLISSAIGYDPSYSTLLLRPVTPFITVSLARQNSWSVSQGTEINGFQTPFNAFRDSFFGIPVHHALVLFILYLTLLGWLIPAVARNIKRDPSDYELYTPTQALGFLFYLNFILIAFCRFSAMIVSGTGGKVPTAQMVPIPPLEVQSTLITINILLFFIFGFILLRNRNRMRRRLHGIEAAPVALESIWPAPYIFLGAILVGAAMILVIQWKRDPSLEWSLTVAIFRVIYFAVWISCDLLFLQWMNLRRGRHPLPLGVLYLIVYYICAGLVVGALHLTQNPFTAIFLPTPLWELNTALWTTHSAEWIVALMGQAAIALVFIFLQRQQIEELQPRPVETRATSSVTAA